MPVQRAAKSRHGLLTAILALMLVTNAIVTISYLAQPDAIRAAVPGAPAWSVYALAGLGVFNLVCVAALFMWKKWAFWGFCVSAALAFIANLSFGIGLGPSLVGLAGPAVLFGVLQIGGDRKGWPQLE